MEQTITLDTVLQLAKRLSAIDKIRLFERLAPEIERALQTTKSRESLRGLWKGLNVTDEDIAETRREMWTDFPRADV